MPATAGTTSAVVVPVKSFTEAKSRLGVALNPTQRARLARDMTASVLSAGRPLPCFVVCGSADVAAWAVGNGAGVIWHRPDGLNEAARFALARLADDGFDRVVIAHGDLPLATDLAHLATDDGVTIVTDRHGGGTNVLSLPATTDFTFRYGPGSAAAHQAEAVRLGLRTRIVSDDRLGWDVDVINDLVALPPTGL